MIAKPQNARNVIFKALQDVFNPHVKGDWWAATDNYPTSVNKVLTTDILSYMVGVYSYTGPSDVKSELQDSMFGEVRNLIWNCYTGGGTCTAIAKKIFDDLKIPYQED